MKIYADLYDDKETYNDPYYQFDLFDFRRSVTKLYIVSELITKEKLVNSLDGLTNNNEFPERWVTDFDPSLSAPSGTHAATQTFNMLLFACNETLKYDCQTL